MLLPSTLNTESHLNCLQSSTHGCDRNNRDLRCSEERYRRNEEQDEQTSESIRNQRFRSLAAMSRLQNDAATMLQVCYVAMMMNLGSISNRFWLASVARVSILSTTSS